MRVAERFYGEMLEAGITPDVQAMNSLINAFSKAGSPDQALQVRAKVLVCTIIIIYRLKQSCRAGLRRLVFCSGLKK